MALNSGRLIETMSKYLATMKGNLAGMREEAASMPGHQPVSRTLKSCGVSRVKIKLINPFSLNDYTI